MSPLAQLLERQLVRYPLALILGLMTTLAFPPYEYLVLLPLALVGLLVLWSGGSPRRAFWTGWWFGVGHFGLGLYWIVISTYVYGGAPIWVSGFLVFLLVSYTSLYPAVLGYVARRWALPTAIWALVQLPLLWALLELLRGWVGTGFPWLSLGYPAIDTGLLRLAPVLGVHGISAALVLLSGALWLLISGSMQTRLVSVITLLALVVVLRVTPPAGSWTQPVGETVSVGIVQGNIAQEDKWRPSMLRPTAERYMKMTQELPEDTRLIIWPEAAIPALYHHVKEPFYSELHDWALERGTTVLSGTLRERLSDRRIINTHFASGLDAGGMYTKRHLVPFGEYFPVPDFLRLFMQAVHLTYEDIAPGPEEQPLVEVAGLKLGISICFEDVFGRDIRRDLPEADVLVNVTNDAWFADSSAPHQHLQIARMRAAEAGRPLLRVSNRGVSGHIGPDGKLREHTGFLTTEWMFTTVAAHEGVTPYVRWGDMPLWILGGLMFFVSLWRGQRISQ